MRLWIPVAVAALVACSPARPAERAAPTVAIAPPSESAGASTSVDPTPPPATPAYEPSLENGRRLYAARGCATCHDHGVGPPLRKMAGSTLNLVDGREITVDTAFVRGAVLDPLHHLIPNYQPIMPTYRGQFRGKELDDLVAYVMSR